MRTYGLPGDLAEAIAQTYDEGTPRQLWSEYVNHISEHLLEKNIKVMPEQLVLVFDREERITPVLDRDYFQMNIPANITPSLEGYSVPLIADRRCKLTMVSPEPIPDEEANFLQHAFYHLGPMNSAVFKNHRDSLLQTSGLPKEEGLRLRMERWKAESLSEIISTHQMTPVNFFVSDVIGFKHLNDRCGTEEGDRLIKELALKLRDFSTDYMPWGDWYVSHLHGDEFAWLYRGNIPAEQAIGDFKGYLGNHPFAARLLNSHSLLHMPFFIGIGSANVQPNSNYGVLKRSAELEMHKDKLAEYDRMMVLYPDSRIAPR